MRPKLRFPDAHIIQQAEQAEHSAPAVFQETLSAPEVRMSFRILSFLFSLVFLAFFIGFNLENRCDVSLIVYTFKDVPVCVSLLFAFVAGALALLPFCLLSGRKPGKEHVSRTEKNIRERHAVD